MATGTNISESAVMQTQTNSKNNRARAESVAKARAETKAYINAKFAELRASRSAKFAELRASRSVEKNPSIAAASFNAGIEPINIEPSILAQIELYKKVQGMSNHSHKDFEKLFRERIALITHAFAIYGLGAYRHAGGHSGGSMISYVITPMSIYGIVSRVAANGLPQVDKAVEMYKFTHPLTSSCRSIFESYSRDPYFIHVGDEHRLLQFIFDLRIKFQEIYRAIPGQQPVDERQLSI
jgi:hypothetical protein